MSTARWLLIAVCLSACGSEPTMGSDAGPLPLDAGPVPGEVIVPPPPCGALVGEPPPRVAPSAPATLSRLHVEGTEVLDEAGNRVALRGINLGSWLQTESWMMGLGLGYDDDFIAEMDRQAESRGVTDLLTAARRVNALDYAFENEPRWVLVQAWRAPMWRRAGMARVEAVRGFWQWFDDAPWLYEEENLWAYVGRRYGEPAVSELREIHHERWITELDMERIAALGLNVVRVPVWYRQLEVDAADGSATPRAQGWQRLDEVVGWARTHRLWVILDLHGAPGGQSVYDHQGLVNGGDLWSREACVERTAALWSAIAARYADEPHVAAYDLLNEPQSPDVDAYARVHDALYRAVREVDTAHIVMIEDGYRGVDRVRSPAEMGWDQSMFSLHAYPSWSDPIDYAAELEGTLTEWGAAWSRFECPVYFGEFNASSGAPDGADAVTQAAAMDAALAVFDARGVHWSPWSWKFHSEATWGVYHPPADRQGFFDPTGRDLASLRARLEGGDSADWEPLVPYTDALRARAAEPAMALRLTP